MLRQLAELLVVCVVKTLAGAGQRPQVILKASQPGWVVTTKTPEAQALSFPLPFLLLSHGKMNTIGSLECYSMSPFMKTE